jgi:hypothetical protein
LKPRIRAQKARTTLEGDLRTGGVKGIAMPMMRKFVPDACQTKLCDTSESFRQPVKSIVRMFMGGRVS